MAGQLSNERDLRLLRALDLTGFSCFLATSCALLVACWIIQRWPTFLGPKFLAVCAVLVLALHATLVSRRVCSVDPVLWVPIALFVFYFGMPVARFLGVTAPYEAWSVQPTRNLGRGFALAMMTLTAFLSGMYLHGIGDRRKPYRGEWQDATAVGWAGVAVLSAAVLFMAVGFIKAGPSVILGMYGEIYESKAMGADFRLFDVGFIFAKAGVFGMLAAHRPRRLIWTSCVLGVSGILLLASARLGDRGGLISFAFAGTWIFSQRVRRIPFSWIAVASLFMVFLLPGVKEYRETRSVQATLKLNPIGAASSTLYEAGTSVLTFAYTLDLIPSEKSYAWGLSYARALLHLVPNLGLTPGKSFMPDVLVSSPSQWLTERIHPAKYEQGGGYGYSVGAEWYFNFGLPGVLFGMAWMGYMLCYFRSRQDRGALWLVWSGLLFSMLELIVRNVIAAPLKAAIWSLLVLWLSYRLLRVITGMGSTRLTSKISDGHFHNIA